jgi:hypothetical protein
LPSFAAFEFSMKHPHDLFSWRPSDSDPWEAPARSLEIVLFLLSLRVASQRTATAAVELPSSVLAAWRDALAQGGHRGTA